MVCFAAFTGARRSELCRSQIVDWRVDDETVKIRQKKRDKDKTFAYRDVHIHPRLAEVTKAWFDDHPGGRFAFCKSDRMEPTWDAATLPFQGSGQGLKVGGRTWLAHASALVRVKPRESGSRSTKDRPMDGALD